MQRLTFGEQSANSRMNKSFNEFRIWRWRRYYHSQPQKIATAYLSGMSWSRRVDAMLSPGS